MKKYGLMLVHEKDTFHVEKVGVLGDWCVYRISKSGVCGSWDGVGEYYGDDEMHALRNCLKGKGIDTANIEIKQKKIV